jgi:hypothetical protein
MTRREFLRAASGTVLAVAHEGQRGVGPTAAQPASDSLSSPRRPTRIGITRDQFSIDGAPRFLLGVSYFDARNWKQPDIDALAARGFNNIRIWMENGGGTLSKHWHLESDGRLKDPVGLLDMIRYCSTKAITVEVTILDWESNPLSTSPELAIDNVAHLLRSEPNVFYDICNEHTHGSGTYASHTLIRSYRDRIKSIQQNQIVTASGCCGHLMGPSDQAIGSDLSNDVTTALLDFVAPHMPRTPKWSSRTGVRVKSVKRYLASIGRIIPVFLQEEARRRHSGLNPAATEFLDAALMAKDAGAAGWIFHTDAGFDLSGRRTFFGSLDAEERRVVDHLAAHIS